MNRLWWALGVMLVAAALFVCLMPLPHMPQTFDFNDKVWHMLGHTALAAYFSGLVQRRGWWKIFVFLLGFGVFVEAAQHYMNMGRQGDVRDVLGNMAGALLGLLLGYLGLSHWPEWMARIFGRRVVT